MCGIAGILFSSATTDERETRLEAMQRALRPRGPDGTGMWCDVHAALSHTRLALLDLESGHQPMVDSSGRHLLVFNGEIYNHIELRDELRGQYAFRTRSDSETLLAAWTVWGEACLERLNGMFSFLIWDSVEQCGFAARDPLGVKPFVYARRGSEFIFASETKAILAGGWGRPSLNRRALAEYLVAPSLSGVQESMIKGIEHLGAGCKLRITREKVVVKKWDEYRVGSGEGDHLAIEALRGALEKSVERAMRADVPVGVFLSGGVDSTLLATLATRHCREPLRAFTYCFEGHDRVDYGHSRMIGSDDAPFVDETVKRIPVELERVVLSQEMMMSRLEMMAAVNDRVPAWEQEFAQDALARSASGRRKAVLVGDAADETHYGYHFLLEEAVSSSPLALLESFDARQREACLSPAIRAEMRPVRRLSETLEEMISGAGYGLGNRMERLRAMSWLVVKLWLGRLLHNGDIHTMAHGVESRVPFADRDVLVVAQGISPLQGYDGGVEKRVLREAARSFVPDAVYRRKKSALPCDPRLGPRYQKALIPLLQEEKVFAEEYFDVSNVNMLCRQPVPDENARMLLFNLLALICWKRHYLG